MTASPPPHSDESERRGGERPRIDSVHHLTGITERTSLCLLPLCMCTHLINVSQLAVDVLAELQQQADGTLVEDVQTEEQRQKTLAER